MMVSEAKIEETVVDAISADWFKWDDLYIYINFLITYQIVVRLMIKTVRSILDYLIKTKRIFFNVKLIMFGITKIIQ